MLYIYEPSELPRVYDLGESLAIRGVPKYCACSDQTAQSDAIPLTVSTAEDDPRLFHRVRHPHAVLHGRRHGLLAEDMVPLRCERLHDRRVHAVLHRDDDGVREARADRLDGLCGRRVERRPRLEDQAAVHLVQLGHPLARLRARLDDGDDFAFVGREDGVLAIRLR